MKSPIIKPHPLDHPGSVKILLGREASEAISANGDYHLAIITYPDATSPTEAHGRMILICLPVPLQTLNAATRVALGKMVATKPRKPATAPTGATTATPPA
jgi:hypothetical protein